MMAEDDNHHFGAVDETTKRLVGRCRRVGWLEDEEAPGLSPTWVKQRFLGVDLPSAMESSLSVVEVTTQREKPGVKTPVSYVFRSFSAPLRLLFGSQNMLQGQAAPKTGPTTQAIS